MLAFAGLNERPLNTGALLRPVSFDAVTCSVSASSVCDTPIAVRGFASSKPAGASAVCAVERWRGFGSSKTAKATAAAFRLPAIVPLGTEVAVFASSILGLALPREFAADAIVSASAELLPFDAVFDAEVSAGASADTLELQRIRPFAAAASMGATSEFEDTVTLNRGFGSVVSVSARATADPDIYRSGVRYAELTSLVDAVATVESEPVISKRMAGATTVTVTSLHTGPVNRRRQVIGGTKLVSAVATNDVRVNTYFAAAVSAGASSSARLGKKQRFAAVASVGAAADDAAIVRPYTRFFPAARSVKATGSASLQRRKALAANAYPIAIAEADPPRLALRCAADAAVGATAAVDATAGDSVAVKFAMDAAVGATVAEDGYFTTRGLDAGTTVGAEAVADMTPLRSLDVEPVTAGAAAEAELRTNVYDDEPDYRTLLVPFQQMVLAVEPQAFVLYVRDDSRNMETVYKQPNEKLAWDVDFAEWFAELEGDDIESASAVVATASAGVVGDLTIEQPLKVGDPCTKLKVWVDAGVNGVTYKITVTANTEGGRRKEYDFKVKVKEG